MTTEGGRLSPAALLESRRGEILEHLRRRLQDTGNLLAKDPAVLPECIARADAILTAAIAEMDGEYERSQAAGQDLASGQQAVLGGTGLLLDSVQHELLNAAADDPGTLAGVVSAALSFLHRSLASATFTAADSYDLFILRAAEEARRRERRQLAREIHDQLGHQLSVALHHLELGALYREDDPAKSADRVDRAREHVTEAIRIARRLITDFGDAKPPIDLRAEIAAFADSASTGGVAVDVRVNGNGFELPDRHRHELLLMVREALVNVFTHAEASTVSVVLDIGSSVMQAVITDDGVGFQPDASPRSGRRGFGMVSMRERAAALGGSVRITSQPNRGTTVAVWLPLAGSSDAG